MRAGEFVLYESYSDRLEQAALEVVARYGSEPADRNSVVSTLQRLAMNVPLGSVSPAEFARDALKVVGNRITFKKAKASASERLQAQRKFKDIYLPRLVDQCMQEMGNIFPDGDPGDVAEVIMARWRNALIPIQQAVGNWLSYQDWFYTSVWPRVQSEFKRLNKDDMWDYLALMWDEQRDQAISDYEHGTGRLNPQWKAANPYRHSR